VAFSKFSELDKIPAARAAWPACIWQFLTCYWR